MKVLRTLKAKRLPRSCNRPDERLSDNRIWPPYASELGGGETEKKIGFEDIEMTNINFEFNE
ncbi:hypothetical protein EM308_03080 [Flavobacterium gilvum]|uniref:Uncharacterized protein n=1 Tax=Flavobacterium gilvum TaxID=1492737 RepID=A0AAC9N4Y5_9FLAO|nr:hypothetical protein EM308_03080 [Flavobacterium gilvum]